MIIHVNSVVAPWFLLHSHFRCIMNLVINILKVLHFFYPYFSNLCCMQCICKMCVLLLK